MAISGHDGSKARACADGLFARGHDAYAAEFDVLSVESTRRISRPARQALKARSPLALHSHARSPVTPLKPRSFAQETAAAPMIQELDEVTGNCPRYSGPLLEGTKEMHLLRGWLALFVAITCLSCGDNEKPADFVPFQTRVVGERPLDTLTPEESQTFCEDFTAHASAFTRTPRLVEGACRLRGNPGKPECEQIKRACIAELNMKPPPEGCSIVPTACTGTVADFTRCWNATDKFLATFLLAIPDCDNRTVEGFDIDMAGELLAADCDAYRSSCPASK